MSCTTGSKCTQDEVTILLELCVRFGQINCVDSRDRIALRDRPECPRIIIVISVLFATTLAEINAFWRVVAPLIRKVSSR